MALRSLLPLGALALLLAACGAAPSPDPSGPRAACAEAPRPATACAAPAVAHLDASGSPQEIKARTRINGELDRLAADKVKLCQDPCADKAQVTDVDTRLAAFAPLQKELADAKTAGQKKRALDKLYRALVPAASRPEEITFHLAVKATLPGSDREIDVGPGDALPTDTRVAFRVEVSRDAYLYIFQKTPNDEVTVLFPEPRIGTANPLRAGTPADIPPGTQRFRLNEKDVGMENVFLVVSGTPLPSLDAALAKVKSGAIAKVGQDEMLRALSQVTPGTPPPGCGTRALELDTGGGASSGGGSCRRSRGLVLEDIPEGRTNPRELSVRTDAGDDLIVKVFPIHHVGAPGKGGFGGQGAGPGGPAEKADDDMAPVEGGLIGGAKGSRGAQLANPGSPPPTPRGIVIEE